MGERRTTPEATAVAVREAERDAVRVADAAEDADCVASVEEPKERLVEGDFATDWDREGLAEAVRATEPVGVVEAESERVVAALPVPEPVTAALAVIVAVTAALALTDAVVEALPAGVAAREGEPETDAGVAETVQVALEEAPAEEMLATPPAPPGPL